MLKLTKLRAKLAKSKKREKELKGIKDRALTVDEQKELDSIKKDKKVYTKQIAIEAAKKVAKAIISIVSKIISGVVALCGSMFGIIILIVLILMIVVTTILGSVVTTTVVVSNSAEGTSGNLSINGSSSRRGLTGDPYVFNTEDLNKLDDYYAKNLYILAWLWTNVKTADSDISLPLTNAMGIPIFEYGNSFFRTYTHEYDDNLISEYACGFPSPSKDSNGNKIPNNMVCQGLYQCNSGDFDDNFASYWQGKGMSKEQILAAVWEGIRDTSKALDAPAGADDWIYQKNGLPEAKAAGDYSGTVYDIGYQVAYAAYINGSYKDALKKEGTSGHTYKEYYDAACKKYGIDGQNDVTLRWFGASIAYLYHAGGMFGSFDNVEDNKNVHYALFDYLGYTYKMLYDGRSFAEYNLDGTGIDWGHKGGSNQAMLCNVYDYDKTVSGGQSAYGHSGASLFTSGKTSLQDSAGVAVLDKNMATLWYESIKGTDMQAKADYYQEVFRGQHGTSTVLTQGSWAGLSGWVTAAAGTSRLNAVFKQLNIEWDINDEGFIVCGNADIEIKTTGYNPAIAVDTFDNSKRSWWQKDWFEQIDESEWCYPIAYKQDLSGGYISSLFGERDYNKNEFHCGIDTCYTNGSSLSTEALPEYAMHSGRVTKIEHNNASCGNYIQYESTWRVFDVQEDKWKYKTGRFLYMHMADIDSSLKEGSQVNRGQLLGHMGTTGGVPLHLHVQLATTGIKGASKDNGIRNIACELPFFTWIKGYQGYVESGTDGRLNGAPIKLEYSDADGSNADKATNSDEHP